MQLFVEILSLPNNIKLYNVDLMQSDYENEN